IFAVDIHRYDGIFIGSINNLDTHPAALPIKRGAGVIELHIPTLELSHNVYFLSLKAYPKDGSPEWHDPADIHNQMYQFDVVSEQPTHGLIKFDAVWRNKSLGENR
ncbi:MAG: Wzt carbohydrate-binding domain-containing protein, partial [Blastocatellia bacterium]